MMGVNLLPWREAAYQRLLVGFLIKLGAMLLVALSLFALLSFWQGQQRENLIVQQQQLEQLKSRLTLARHQVSQLQSTMQNFTTLQAISPQNTAQLLSLLPQLPFQQGELEGLIFEAENLQLNGFSMTQSEFEALHEFLTAHFAQVTLSQFKPEKGQLFFQFDIPLNEKGANQ